MASSAIRERRIEKARHLVATAGSLTERGGVVIAEGGVFARVGDLVRYPDGTQTKVRTGAWKVVYHGKPIAVVGSELCNGDRIVMSTSDSAEVVEFVGDEPILVERIDL